METIIALDFGNAAEMWQFLENFKDEPRKPYVKVGMELFYAEGPEIVRELKKKGFRIFLDLKLHDIPNTVGSAMKVLSGMDVDMVNVHASGGRRMMETALQSLTRPDGSRPLLIAVTQLTSTSQDMLEDELLINRPVEDVVGHYALNAAAAGLDGVVCSPREVKKIKALCGPDFITVTPGIRFADSAKDDQVRITTPEQAYAMGTNYIVVGRPITRSASPLESYKRCQIQEK